jgi:hypothetical protein
VSLHLRALRYLGVALALVALCAIGPAFARDDASITVGLHAASKHLPKYEWQSGFNPGVYVRTSAGWTAGVYRNTLARTTLYAGRTWSNVLGPIDVMAAAATGYSLAPLVPLVVASVELAPTSWPVVPRLSAGRGADSWVLHLSIERSF